jgi:hypothetical protein
LNGRVVLEHPVSAIVSANRHVASFIGSLLSGV